MAYEYFILLIGIIGLLFSGYFSFFIKRKCEGSKRMAEFSKIIKEGAKSYLKKQYKILAFVLIIVAIVLIISLGIKTGIAFLFGAVLSAFSGIIGMMVATSSNARTAQGCKKSLNDGLRIAFSAGAVMGTIVVCFGLLGILFSYWIFNDLDVLFGFGFGASLTAVFARVGGGIYTKAADIGADLVGKIEKGIPEDDPRNPAVIADLVGDNVGDVAGMGADLYESYVQSIIAAMSLGAIFLKSYGVRGVLFPMLIASLGIIASIIGTFFVRIKKGDPNKALDKGGWISALLLIIFSYSAVVYILGVENLKIFYAILFGIITGIAIGINTEYFTSSRKRPAITIAEASKTGAGTNIITGFSIALKSTIIPIIFIVISIILSYRFGGLFGVSIASVGMLSTLSIILANETYASVSDNAAGISEMSGLEKVVRQRAEDLDAVGNSTAAMGKGFDNGAAAFTALALFSVYGTTSGLASINVISPEVLGGLFLGALLPFAFSSMTISAVGKTAITMVNEVRRQFSHNKNILKGKAKPDYNKPIEISTEAALKRMILPGIIAILVPLIVGIILGKAALGGLLVGTTVMALLLSITFANAGGAWDNAKKYIERGNFGGKGSEAHKAAIVGDTVGDPFKDTAGPSLNILIKIVAVVSILYVIMIGWDITLTPRINEQGLQGRFSKILKSGQIARRL